MSGNIPQQSKSKVSSSNSRVIKSTKVGKPESVPLKVPIPKKVLGQSSVSNRRDLGITNYANSVSKEIKADQKDIVRMGLNPYLMSLLDPFNYHGAKIPDSVLYPSAPLTILDRRTLTTMTNGLTGIIYGLGGANGSQPWGSLVPVYLTNGGTAYHANVSGQIAGTGFALSNIFPSTGMNSDIVLDSFQSNAIQGAFNKLRLVSCGVTIEYTGTTLNDSGKFTLAFAPRATIRTMISSSVPVTYDYISKLPGALVVPIPRHSGGSVLYKPQDNLSTEYSDVSQVTDVLNDRYSFERAMGGEMFLLVDGGVPGGTFAVTAYFNFEGIPNTETFSLVNVTPSISDPIAMAHTSNVIERTPVTIAMTGQQEGLIGPGLDTSMAPTTAPKAHLLGRSRNKKAGLTINEPVQQEPMIDRIIDLVANGAKGVSRSVSTLAPLAKLMLGQI